MLEITKHVKYLPASGWANSKQSVNIVGIDEDSYVIVTPVSDSASAYATAGVRHVYNLDGKLVFQCNTVPSNGLAVEVLVFDGVEAYAGE